MKHNYFFSTKVYLLSLLLSFFSNYLFGQGIPYSSLHTDQSINNKGININLAVGSTPGSGDVSSGAASYSIPIAVPPGTAGVTPALSINYNSMGGNGQLGMGWGLSGMSAITRVGKNFYHDGEVRAADFSFQDKFALDGQRLLLKAGNYGESGTTYYTENENFSEIASYQATNNGSVTSFKVVTADGLVMDYGNTPNSKIETVGYVMTWLLNRVTYPNGNYIEYIYTTNGLETLISEIKYTGNDIVGLVPYNSVKFEYKTRTDNNFYYQIGVKRETNVLLDKIVIKADGVVFKNYVLTYGLNSNISYLTHVTHTRFELG